jgi:hypothetical protein
MTSSRIHKMHASALIAVLIGMGQFVAITQSAVAGSVYTDPGKAEKQSPAFRLQGEYISAQVKNDQASKHKKHNLGLQVVARGKKRFQARLYQGGLPGAGYEGEATALTLTGKRNGATLTLKGKASANKKTERPVTATISNGKARVQAFGRTHQLKRVHRTSPTLGQKPPEDAVVLFDGTKQSLKAWVNGEMTDAGLLKEGTHTRQKFHAFTLHLEFRLPFKPNAWGQSRGNSGIYVLGRYEVQLLDSFGRAPQHDFCGALYKFQTPRVNMTYPPLNWQTYDITFVGPALNDQGEKLRNARITVRHNGVVIHEALELPGGTGAGGDKPEVEAAPIYLQGHNNPVRFRNIWLVPHDDK